MTMIEYAKTFLGTPYVWGGNTPEQGFDCSGFICEVLRSEGKVGNSEDLTAQQIYYKFLSGGLSSSPKKGSLVFYGESVDRITHIAMVVDVKQPYIGESVVKVIEAAGEGRQSSDKGFVRIRKINYRSDMVAIIDRV